MESRDVLGNIKGTFGFVDAEGEIKRVSYSSSNGTGFKATTVSPLQEQVSVVQSIPRTNLTSTTRKPNIIYATEASARSSVVQTIPRHRKTTTTSTTTTSTTTTTEAPSSKPSTYYGHYVKSTPARTRPRFGVHSAPQRAPLVVEEDAESEDEQSDSQINRPVVQEERVISAPYRRIIYAKRPVEMNRSLRPITEEFEDDEEEVKITTGNTLRRQLSEDTTKSEGTVEAVDEHADVYGGALSVSRPLFTTITPPRVLQRGSGVRVERPKPIYVNQENLGPARFDQRPKFEANRVFESDAKAAQEERNAQQQQILFRAAQKGQATAQASRDYARQSSEPVYVREHPDQQQFLREVPPEGIIVEARRANDNEDEPASYRQVPLGRIIFRPLPNQQPLYPATSEPDHMRQYLPEPAPEHLQAVPRQNYLRPRPRPVPVARPLSYPDEDSRAGLDGASDEEDYAAAQDYPYRPQNVALPPEPVNPITPPLSRRDFQMLLRRLLISQYGARALAYPRTYLEDALYDQQPYSTYQTEYQTQVPRQSLHRGAYDPAAAQAQYGERLGIQSVPLRRPGFSRALNPIYQPNPNRYEDYQDSGYGKRVYRQKFYAHETGDTADNEEVLPPPVREALLLRMLQLAINPDRPVMQQAIMTATQSPPATYRYRKMGPVRNVQIINDEDDEEKDLMGKKI